MSAPVPPSASLLARLKSINRELNNLEALAGVSDVRARPTHLEVDFSSRCNYRCPMCHQSKFDMGRFALDRAQLDTLIDSLPYVDTVMIAGLGEPLLYPGLPHFLPWLRRYRCHVHLFTNGELIHRRLDCLRDLDRISVSLDGATPATFEALRRGGHFGRVVANIRALRAAAPRTELVTSTVVSRRNVGEVGAIVALAASLKMQAVNLSPVDHTPSLMLRHEDAAVFHAQLAEARRQHPDIEIHNNIGSAHFRPDRNTQVAPADLDAALRAAAFDKSVEREDEDEPETWPQSSVPNQYIHGLDEATQLRELARRVHDHQQALAALQARIHLEHRPLALPYCAAPWKYGFARSRGDARLCPYADVSLGPVQSVMAGPYNTPLLTALRDSMRNDTPCLSVCTGCTDDHRRFRRDSLEATLAEHSGFFRRAAVIAQAGRAEASGCW